jgi:hypothetical protein
MPFTSASEEEDSSAGFVDGGRRRQVLPEYSVTRSAAAGPSSEPHRQPSWQRQDVRRFRELDANNSGSELIESDPEEFVRGGERLATLGGGWSNRRRASSPTGSMVGTRKTGSKVSQPPRSSGSPPPFEEETPPRPEKVSEGGAKTSKVFSSVPLEKTSRATDGSAAAKNPRGQAARSSGQASLGALRSAVDEVEADPDRRSTSPGAASSVGGGGRRRPSVLNLPKPVASRPAPPLRQQRQQQQQRQQDRGEASVKRGGSGGGDGSDRSQEPAAAASGNELSEEGESHQDGVEERHGQGQGGRKRKRQREQEDYEEEEDEGGVGGTGGDRRQDEAFGAGEEEEEEGEEAQEGEALVEQVHVTPANAKRPPKVKPVAPTRASAKNGGGGGSGSAGRGGGGGRGKPRKMDFGGGADAYGGGESSDDDDDVMLGISRSKMAKIEQRLRPAIEARVRQKFAPAVMALMKLTMS